MTTLVYELMEVLLVDGKPGWYLIEGKAKYWDGESWRRNKFNQPAGNYQLENGVKYWDGTNWHNGEFKEFNAAKEVFGQLANNEQYWQDMIRNDIRRMSITNDHKLSRKRRRREVIASGLFIYGAGVLIATPFAESINAVNGIITFLIAVTLANFIMPD